MKILLIGGNGTIGKRVKERLQRDHEIIVAGQHSGDFQFNLANILSIKKLFESIGQLDAVICTAGETKWDKFELLQEEDYQNGIQSKLMGQINLVRIGREYIRKGGSITLISGILGDEPVPTTTIPAMVDGAIHSFVLAVDLELPDIRVNVICPDLVEDSFEKLKDYFPGHIPVPMDKITDAYVECVEGNIRGQIIRINGEMAKSRNREIANS
jgi:NAD(P)-dependent dehydrogenase (short-subunit alcohol dehydrogenase family)